MTLKIVETTVTENSVRVRFADNPDPSEGNPLSEPRKAPLAAIHQAALRYARDAIDAEIDALESLDGRNYR